MEYEKAEGENQYCTEKDKEGYVLDPVTLERIPKNLIIRIDAKTPTGDIVNYCYDIRTLHEWVILKYNNTNPMTNDEFSDIELARMSEKYENVKDSLPKMSEEEKLRIKAEAKESLKRGKEQAERLIREQEEQQLRLLEGIEPNKLLLDSIESDNILGVKNALQRGADVNVQDNIGNTPLLIASEKGYLNIIKLLIEKGADINVQDNHNDTPLHLASMYSGLELVKCLIENGADINIKNDEGDTPLHLASIYGYLDIVKYLVEISADINIKNDDDENTPLHLASEDGHLEVVKYLVENGADINIKNIEGNTPLLLASEEEHLEITNFLENYIYKPINNEVIKLENRNPLIYKQILIDNKLTNIWVDTLNGDVYQFIEANYYENSVGNKLTIIKDYKEDFIIYENLLVPEIYNNYELLGSIMEDQRFDYTHLVTIRFSYKLPAWYIIFKNSNDPVLLKFVLSKLVDVNLKDIMYRDLRKVANTKPEEIKTIVITKIDNL